MHKNDIQATAAFQTVATFTAIQNKKKGDAPQEIKNFVEALKKAEIKAVSFGAKTLSNLNDIEYASNKNRLKIKDETQKNLKALIAELEANGIKVQLSLTCKIVSSRSEIGDNIFRTLKQLNLQNTNEEGELTNQQNLKILHISNRHNRDSKLALDKNTQEINIKTFKPKIDKKLKEEEKQKQIFEQQFLTIEDIKEMTQELNEQQSRQATNNITESMQATSQAEMESRNETPIASPAIPILPADTNANNASNQQQPTHNSGLLLGGMPQDSNTQNTDDEQNNYNQEKEDFLLTQMQQLPLASTSNRNNTQTPINLNSDSETDYFKLPQQIKPSQETTKSPEDKKEEMFSPFLASIPQKKNNYNFSETGFFIPSESESENEQNQEPQQSKQKISTKKRSSPKHNIIIENEEVVRQPSITPPASPNSNLNTNSRHSIEGINNRDINHNNHNLPTLQQNSTNQVTHKTSKEIEEIYHENFYMEKQGKAFNERLDLRKKLDSNYKEYKDSFLTFDQQSWLFDFEKKYTNIQNIDTIKKMYNKISNLKEGESLCTVFPKSSRLLMLETQENSVSNEMIDSVLSILYNCHNTLLETQTIMINNLTNSEPESRIETSAQNGYFKAPQYKVTQNDKESCTVSII